MRTNCGEGLRRRCSTFGGTIPRNAEHPLVAAAPAGAQLAVAPSAAATVGATA
jgi:hypothetical protein